MIMQFKNMRTFKNVSCGIRKGLEFIKVAFTRSILKCVFIVSWLALAYGT
jgi:hypothetical protein